MKPLNTEEIGKLFYELEFAAIENKHEALREIATKISWQYSIFEIIESLKDPVLRSTSRSHAKLIQAERTYNSFKKIASKPLSRNYEDLEEGVFLLSEIGDPYISYIELKDNLDRLATRINNLFLDHREILSEESKVQILIRILAEEEGYTGNTQNYEDPNNSYLTKVIKMKKGIPITLSVLYILVGRRLGIPFFGTNMPFHFLIVYDSPNYSTFIDPYNNGILLDKNTCENFLNRNGFKPSKKYFTRTSTSSILLRMIRNLINIYKKNNWIEMIDLLEIYHQVLDKNR